MHPLEPAHGRHLKTLNDSGRLGDFSWGLLALPPLGPGHHHVDVAAAARRADEPLAPLGDACFGPVALGDLGSIRLDLMTALRAPNNETHPSLAGGLWHIKPRIVKQRCRDVTPR